MITKADFYDMLEKHDWTYDFSDDRNAWLRGQKSYENICAILELHPEYRGLYDEYHRHKFFQTEKPTRPESEVA